MIIEPATVIRCDGKRVELALHRGSACDHCELNQGCGTGALGRLLGHRSKPIVVETDQNLDPGDHLTLGLSESALVKASLIIYGSPLLGMIIAGWIAVMLSVPEIWIPLVAIIGFFAGFKIAIILAHMLEENLLSPHIIDIQVNPMPGSES